MENVKTKTDYMEAKSDTTAQKKKNKLLRLVVNTLLVLVIIFSLFLMYGKINNRFYKLIVVTSGSMSPAIKTGDLIFVVPTDSSKVKIGDVVTFHSEQGSLVTHRIIDIKADGEIITQGDANDSADFWANDWKLETVAAKYVFRIPKLGYVFSWFGGLFNGTGANLKDDIIMNGNQIVADIPPTEETLTEETLTEETLTEETSAEETPVEERPTGVTPADEPLIVETAPAQ